MNTETNAPNLPIATLERLSFHGVKSISISRHSHTMREAAVPYTTQWYTLSITDSHGHLHLVTLFTQDTESPLDFTITQELSS